MKLPIIDPLGVLKQPAEDVLRMLGADVELSDPFREFVIDMIVGNVQPSDLLFGDGVHEAHTPTITLEMSDTDIDIMARRFARWDCAQFERRRLRHCEENAPKYTKLWLRGLITGDNLNHFLNPRGYGRAVDFTNSFRVFLRTDGEQDDIVTVAMFATKICRHVKSGKNECQDRVKTSATVFLCLSCPSAPVSAAAFDAKIRKIDPALDSDCDYAKMCKDFARQYSLLAKVKREDELGYLAALDEDKRWSGVAKDMGWEPYMETAKWYAPHDPMKQLECMFYFKMFDDYAWNDGYTAMAVEWLDTRGLLDKYSSIVDAEFARRNPI